MLLDINLISNRQFKIRNFKEDKNATLSANPGLRYDGKGNEFHKFTGNFYLTNPAGELIESFEIRILVPNTYPNAFPIVFSIDDKIDKTDDYHIGKEGTICVEHTYIANKLVGAGLRLYDFINYYLPKYFSWVLLKQNGLIGNLQEWAHQDQGTIQVYQTLLNISDKETIKRFLEGYLRSLKIRRNDKCYCGGGKKIKYCHYKQVLFLNATPKNSIAKDISLFS